jgi:hypothetical protein
MPDRQQFAEAFKTESKARFPILTDTDNGYALSLNLVIWVGAELARMISAAGRDIPKYQAMRRGCFPSGFFCRRQGWKGYGALRRSGLSQAHGDRRHDRSVEKRTLEIDG